MKKWLKRILFVFLALFLIVAIYVGWNWTSFSIILGTESLSEESSAIPKPVQEIPELILAGDTDWNSWYGPYGNRHSLVTGISTNWTEGLEKVWEVDYLCQGAGSAAWSAPVIQGNRLIVCGRDTEKDHIFGLEPSTGELIWHKSYAADSKNSHGSGTRATPYIDKEYVYTYGRNGDLVCWKIEDGEKVWHKNVMDEGGGEPFWGHSSSPLIEDSLVIVQGGGDIRTVAFHKTTGMMVWASGKGLPGYAAPVTMNINGQKSILAFHGKGLVALDFTNGLEFWNVDWETSYDVNATTPLVKDDKVFITSGYGTGCRMMRVHSNGVDSLWQSKEYSAQHSDPHALNGCLYGYSGDSHQNKGAFKCIDIATGKINWSTNAMGWGTCTWVDGYLLCCDIKGNLFLMNPSPDKFVLVTNFDRALGKISGPVWTVPVVANNHLYLRFKQKLVCYKIVATHS